MMKLCSLKMKLAVALSMLDCRVASAYQRLKEQLFEELLLGVLMFEHCCSFAYFFNVAASTVGQEFDNFLGSFL